MLHIVEWRLQKAGIIGIHDHAGLQNLAKIAYLSHTIHVDAAHEAATLWLRVPVGIAPAYLKGPVPLERRQSGERVKLLCDRVEVAGGTLHLKGCVRDLR